MENFVIQSEEGVYVEEAEDVAVKNVAVYSANTSPIVTVRNSQRISLDRFQFKKDAETLILLAGERTRNISLLSTEVSLARTGFRYAEGASPAALR